MNLIWSVGLIKSPLILILNEKFTLTSHMIYYMLLYIICDVNGNSPWDPGLVCEK